MEEVERSKGSFYPLLQSSLPQRGEGGEIIIKRNKLSILIFMIIGEII